MEYLWLLCVQELCAIAAQALKLAEACMQLKCRQHDQHDDGLDMDPSSLSALASAQSRACAPQQGLGPAPGPPPEPQKPPTHAAAMHALQPPSPTPQHSHDTSCVPSTSVFSAVLAMPPPPARHVPGLRQAPTLNGHEDELLQEANGLLDDNGRLSAPSPIDAPASQCHTIFYPPDSQSRRACTPPLARRLLFDSVAHCTQGYPQPEESSSWVASTKEAGSAPAWLGATSGHDPAGGPASAWDSVHREQDRGEGGARTNVSPLDRGAPEPLISQAEQHIEQIAKAAQQLLTLLSSRESQLNSHSLP